VASAFEVFLNDMHYINSRFTYLLTFTSRATDRSAHRTWERRLSLVTAASWNAWRFYSPSSVDRFVSQVDECGRLLIGRYPAGAFLNTYHVLCLLRVGYTQFLDVLSHARDGEYLEK